MHQIMLHEEDDSIGSLETGEDHGELPPISHTVDVPKVRVSKTTTKNKLIFPNCLLGSFLGVQDTLVLIECHFFTGF